MMQSISEKAKRIFDLRKISIVKTLRFNIHYFGWNGLKCPVIVYKNFHLYQLNGKVVLNSMKTGTVRLGKQCIDRVDIRYERGVWQNNGEIRFNGKCVLGCGTKITCDPKATISFEDEFWATAKAEIVCSENITFGEDVLVSWDTLIMDTDSHTMVENGIDQPKTAPIHIGNHCWVGCRSMILKGSKIPNGTVIAAGSTITKQFQVENVLLGNCNQVLKTGIAWHH